MDSKLLADWMANWVGRNSAVGLGVLLDTSANGILFIT